MQPLVTGEKTLPVRPGMFLETVSKVVLHFAFCVEWFALKPSGPKIPLSYKIFSPLENFTIGKPARFSQVLELPIWLRSPPALPTVIKMPRQYF